MSKDKTKKFIKPKTTVQAEQAPEVSDATTPVVSLVKINRTIPPGLVFLPASAAEAAKLEALGAVRAATESELALYEKTNPADAPAADDSDQNPLGS